MGNTGKIEPKEPPACSIPHLLIEYTKQLEILVFEWAIHIFLYFLYLYM